jgi:hypothetical protein
MLTISGANWFGRRAGTCRLHAIYDQSWIYVGKVGETVKYGWARHPRRGRSVSRLECRLSSAHFNMLTKPRQAAERSYAASRSLHHSILGRRARVQNDDHHVQANLPAAKTTTHTMRNRNIETAKLACFLNSLRPSLIRVVRRENIERTKRKIGIAAAMKAMILKIIVYSQCRVTRSFDHLVGCCEERLRHFTYM